LDGLVRDHRNGDIAGLAIVEPFEIGRLGAFGGGISVHRGHDITGSERDNADPETDSHQFDHDRTALRPSCKLYVPSDSASVIDRAISAEIS